MEDSKKEVLKNAENDSKEIVKGEVADIGSDLEIVYEDVSNSKPNADITLSNEPKSTALIAQEEAVLNSVEVITLEKMRFFAKEVIKSGVSSFKREADVIVVLIRGAELGLPYGVSVNNIFAINGKTGMSVHLHKAMLQKAGIYFELQEDNVPVYAYGLLKPNPNDTSKEMFVPMGTTTSTKVAGFSVSPLIVDRQTTYYFERNIKMPYTGEIKTKKVTSSYRYSEAQQAGLVEKDVWIKYQRSLMKARAFTNGASDIASDVIQGMYGINELAMEYGKDFKIDNNLQESFIDIPHEDTTD